MQWVTAVVLVLLALLLFAKNVSLYSVGGWAPKLYLFFCEVVGAATLGVGVYNILVLSGVIG